MVGLFEDVWGDRKQIVTDHAVDVTLPVCSTAYSSFRVPDYRFVDCLVRYWCCRLWKENIMEGRPRYSFGPQDGFQGAYCVAKLI